MTEIAKSDWRLFKAKLPGWQEAYMEKLNDKYLQLLKQDEVPSKTFWKLEKEIELDKKSTGVRVALNRKRDLPILLAGLLYDGAINERDLLIFSETLQEQVSRLVND